MSGTPKKTVQGTNHNQKYIYGRLNENYQGPQKANETSVSGDLSSALSDFSSEVPNSDYPELEYPSATFDTNPDMDYLLEDEEFVESMRVNFGIEDDEEWKPEIDYNDISVIEQISSDIEWCHENVKMVAQEWADNLDDESEYVLIKGEDIGWRHLSGHKVMKMFDFLNNPVASIQPDTNDLAQTWNNDNGTLTATQSHHDAIEEKYTFTPIDEDQADEYGYHTD